MNRMLVFQPSVARRAAAEEATASLQLGQAKAVASSNRRDMATSSDRTSLLMGGDQL
jgi:hypothetical protein